jgi:hypothetical protein
MIGPQSGEVQQAAGGPPGGYGPPPGGGSYGPPGSGGGGGYGPPPPPGGGGYGPPPAPPPGPGYTQLGPGGPPPGAVQATVAGGPLGMTGGPAAPAKKGGAGGKIVIALLALLAIGGGAFAAYWFWMRSTGPELAKFMPADTQVYVEMPSVTKAVVAAIGMDSIEAKELDAEKRKDDMVEAFESSFDVKKDEAEAFLTSISSVAFGGRELNKDDKAEAALIIRFSDRDAVEAVLGSKRFDKDGNLAGGVAYTMTRKESKDPEKEEKLNAYEKFFNQLGDRKKSKDEDDGDKEEKKKKKNVLVWFESDKLLVAGDQGMVEEIGKVIDGGDNLAKHNETFKKAKWPAGSSMLAYADPEAFPKEIRKDFFSDVGPVTGSMRFTDPGLIVSAHLEMQGKKVSKKELLPETVSLSLYEKLPATTVAYLGFSTKFGVGGKEMEKVLKKTYSDVDERGAEEVEKMLDGMKDNLGFSFSDVFDALGDEAIIGITADDKLFGLAFEKDKEALEHGSVIAIFALDKDEGKDNAEKIIKKLKGTIEEKAKDEIEIKKTDGGFVASPGERAKTALGVDASFSIAVEEDKYMVVIVGTKKRIDEANDALGGTETLKNDKAHKKALTAFEGKPLAVLWVDAGRIGKAVLKESKDIKTSMKDAGVPLDAFILEGDERLTAGYAVRAAFDGEILSVDFDTLNLPVFAAVSAAPMFFARKKESSE